MSHAPTWCHTDEWGNLHPGCYRTYLEGYQRGYLLGYRQSIQRIRGELDQAAAEVVRGAIKSVDVAEARSKPYTIPAWAGGDR